MRNMLVFVFAGMSLGLGLSCYVSYRRTSRKACRVLILLSVLGAVIFSGMYSKENVVTETVKEVVRIGDTYHVTTDSGTYEADTVVEVSDSTYTFTQSEVTRLWGYEVMHEYTLYMPMEREVVYTSEGD